MRKVFILGLLCLCSLSAAPAVGEEIIWLRDADEAWAEAVKADRPLVLFITRSKCRFCMKMKSVTFADPEVSEQINSSFVPLAIDPKTDAALIKELKIASFPTTLIISPDAVTLERIKGYLPPQEFLDRLARSSAPATASQTRSSRR